MLTKAEQKLFKDFETSPVGSKARKLFGKKAQSCCLTSHTPLGRLNYALFYGIQGFFRIEPGLRQQTLSVDAGLMVAKRRGLSVKQVIDRIKADVRRLRKKEDT